MAEKKEKNYLMYYLIGFIVIVLLILFFVFINIDVKVKANVKLRCDDGTVYGECSSSKPYYCSNGTVDYLPNKCGCPEGMTLADGKCKIIADLVPDTNYNCSELVPAELSIRFNIDNLPIELSNLYNKLTNNLPLSNVPGKGCIRHDKAKAGENVDIESIFYCYGISEGGGGVVNNIAKKSYKISYEFTIDNKDCRNLSVTGVDIMKRCSLNMINCSWAYK